MVVDMNLAGLNAVGASARSAAAAPARRWRWSVAALVLIGALLGVGLFIVKAEQAGEPAVAAPKTPVAADRSRLLAERDRLVRENAALTARLRDLEAQDAVAEKLDAQATRLAELAERLEARLADTEAGKTFRPGGEATGDAHAAITESQSSVERLQARVAQLEARLKQQRLIAEEAVMRADKAEKLHAALEEAHARVRTENQRLSLELATAKERQTQAMQRVLELDTQLEATAARAGIAAPASELLPAPGPETAAHADAAESAGAPSTAGNKVVYEVREEDTLSRIAAKVYGDASAWQRIFDANRDVLDGPDDLALGMRLIIP
jgi:nucleoid-associated protein YgaU